MRKSTWTAVTLFVALAVGSVWTLTRKAERGITRLAFDTLDTSTVDKIEVTGQNPVVLVKTGGVWRVLNGRDADQGAVDALLSNAKRIHSADIISQDHNRFGEFEVDAEKGRDVSLYAGPNKVAEFVVGKSLQGQTGATAMRSGDTVYKVKDVFAYVFGRTVSDWTERHVTHDQMADINRFNVRLQGEKPFTVAAMEKAWDVLADGTQPKDYRFDATAGQTLLTNALGLQAQALLDADPGLAVTKLDDTADTITWFFKDEAAAKVPSHTLTLGASREDKSVYAKVDGHDGIFTVAESTARGLRRSLADLRDLSLMKVDPAQVVSVTINDGTGKLTFERADPKAEWKLASGKVPAGYTLDPMKVLKRVQMAAHARATGVAPEGQTVASTGVKAAKQAITMVLADADKTKAALTFGNKAADGWYGTGNIDSQVFVVGSYMHDQLLGGLDTFKKQPGEGAGGDPFAQLDPSTLANLPPEIRANLQQQIAKKQREQQMLQQMQPRQQ